MEHSQPNFTEIAGIRLTPGILLRFGLLLIFLLYLQDLRFEFVYDDLMIPLSPLNQSWHGVLNSFTQDVFSAMGERTNYYRPIATALAVIVARATPGTSAWFHLIAIVIHVVLCLACFFFTRLLVKQNLVAVLSTLFFALHPSKVECVAWIGSAVCDGQAAIYFFVVLIFYLQWFSTRRVVWFVSSFCVFLLSVFTKETMIVLPLLIAVHWFLTSGAKDRQASFLLLLPYFVIAGGYVVVRHKLLAPLPTSSTSIRPTIDLSALYSAPSAFWWYAKRLCLPYRLSILYDWQPVSSPSFSQFVLPFAALLTLAAIFAIAWYRGRSRTLLFMLAWFVIMLGPVLVLAPSVTVHDRYLELAAYPFCVLLAFLVLTLWDRSTTLGAVLALLIVAAYSASTFHEASFWKDSFSLWGRAVETAPRNVIARTELARLYATAVPPDYTRSISVLDDGLRLLPASPGLWRTRGLLLLNAGDYDRSRLSLLRSLRASDEYLSQHGTEPPDVHYGRATADFFLGQIEMVEGNSSAAEQSLRQAVQINPENLQYQKGLLMFLRKQGRTDEANQREQILRDLVARSTAKLAH